MDTTPEAPVGHDFGPSLAKLWFVGLLAWSAVVAYVLWPSFRWQIEYFKGPGPAAFYGILIVAPLLTFAALLYSRIRGSHTIPWEPVVICAPLLALALRQPWGVACTVLLLGSSLALGRLVLARLGLLERIPGQWTFSLLTGVCVWAWVLSMVGLAGFLFRPLLWAAAVIPAVWTLKLAPDVWRTVRAIPSVWAEDREVQQPLTGVLIPFLALFVLSGVLLVAAPTVINDAVIFHLPIVQKWVGTGSLTPSFDHPYSFNPQAFEVLLGWAYTMGGAPAAQVFCLALSLLGLAVCWRLVRMLGGSQQSGVVAMAVIASAPFLHWTASVLKNDWLMATLQVACAVCLLRWRSDRDVRWILLGCWFLGSSFGVKHSALFAAVGLGLLVMRAFWQSHRRVSVLAAIAVIMASTATVWHVRTYLVTGDPAYPAGAFLASRAFTPSTEVTRNPLLRAALVIRAVHGHSNNLIFENVLPAPAGTLLTLLIPLVFISPRDRWTSDRRAMGLVAAVGLLYWVTTTANLRYAVTPLLLLACLLAVALTRAYAQSSPAIRRLLSAIVAYGLLFGWTGTLIIENSGPQVRYVAGLLSADDYIASVHPALPAVRRLGEIASPDDRILGGGCCLPAYYPVSWRFDCPFGANPNEAVGRAAEMAVRVPYQYFIEPRRGDSPPLPPNEVVYEDRACTIRRFLPQAPMDNRPRPANMSE